MGGGGVGCMGGCGGEGGHLAGQLHTCPLGVGHVTPPGSKEVGEGGGGLVGRQHSIFTVTLGNFFGGNYICNSIPNFWTIGGRQVGGKASVHFPQLPIPHPLGTMI